MELTIAVEFLSISLATVVLVVLLYVVVDWLLRRRRIPDITSKYVLITGCDSGFGERVCEKLDLLGCNVIATCLTETGVSEIQRKCSWRTKAFLMDVTNEESIQRAVETVSKILPPGKGLWGLVNNAGISGEVGPVEWLEPSNMEIVLKVNVLGTYTVVHSFLPLIKKSGGGGRIVNTASILGRLSIPFIAPYCMSKFAVEAFSDALRIELHRDNIKVAIIEPGGHKTPFLDKISQFVHSAWKKLPEYKKQEYGDDYLKQVLFLGTKLIPFLGSTDLNPVADAYCHALLSVRPRRRYLVGLDAIALSWFTYLPSFLNDVVCLIVIWLSGKFT